MKIMLVRDRNVLNNNWLAYFANLLHERGHEVVIACDTYGKLGVSAPGQNWSRGLALPMSTAKPHRRCRISGVVSVARYCRRGACLTV